MHEKWMKLIEHVWVTIFYRELADQYLKDKPADYFFHLTWFAVKEKMLMGIAHAVALCKAITEQIDIGSEAAKTLEELNALYKRGDTKDHAALDFDDCGLMVFRDKVLAHPVNKTKEIGGKDPYKVSMKWETIDATLGKIREFCEQVERHNAKDWQNASYLEGTGEAADALKRILFYMEEAKKYEQLKSQIIKRGKPRVWYDWQSRDFVIEND